MIRKTQKGFTLIEVLVAVTIFVLILVGVISIFLSLQRSQLRADDMRATQDNLRYITEVMASDIRDHDIPAEADFLSNELTLGDTYYYVDDEVLYREVGAVAARLSNADVDITRMSVYVVNPESVEPEQGRVTVVLEAQSTDKYETTLAIQATISSLVY